MRVLSFHGDYACRHSGKCCSAGWIEPREDGVCRHFDAHAAGSCSIQRARGHQALPHACQQFPRVATLSPLGTSVTLSAFCPTAASLLFADGPFEIVAADSDRHVEGLDATQVMPPLLRDGMLMDWDAVARWEQLTIATLSDHRHDIARALEIIETASERVCGTWTPADGALDDALREEFSRSRDSGVSSATPLKDRRRDRSLARPHPGGAGDMPESAADRYGEAAPRSHRGEHSAALARYVAAHAFACWPMYDGRGIRGALEWMKTVRATLEDERRSQPGDLKEAMRQADLRLRHAISLP